MASSHQGQRILTQGKKYVSSTTKKPVPEEGENSDQNDEKSPTKRSKAIRPNAFLSFRITNPRIIDQANDLQKQIIQTNPLLSKASVTIPTLHVTLLVFALKNEEDKTRARQSLVDVYQAITAARLSPPQITFTGLSHFNNTVLYIDPVKDGHLDQLTRIAGICREIYERNGILTTDTRPFNPHLTLFKLSKAPDLRRKGVRKIDEYWTTKYTGHYFGTETFRSLQLCNMLKKQTDGYYEIFNEQDLFHEKLDLCPPMLMNLVETTIVEVEGMSDEPQRSVVDPSLLDESAPLLQRDQPTYEGPFTGFASFVSSSRSRTCSCCSIA